MTGPETQILSRLASTVMEDMIPAIDPGDLNRDGAPKSEHWGRVRDGSKGDIIGGYPLLNVVAHALKKGTTLPLFCQLYSC